MTNEKRAQIIDAVNEVYEKTETLFVQYETNFVLTVPGVFGDRKVIIKISRNTSKDDLTYKLYTQHSIDPLLTVFGCWPIEFVTDIFIRAMEHFFNDY